MAESPVHPLVQGVEQTDAHLVVHERIFHTEIEGRSGHQGDALVVGHIGEVAEFHKVFAKFGEHISYVRVLVECDIFSTGVHHIALGCKFLQVLGLVELGSEVEHREGEGESVHHTAHAEPVLRSEVYAETVACRGIFGEELELRSLSGILGRDETEKGGGKCACGISVHKELLVVGSDGAVAQVH